MAEYLRIQSSEGGSIKIQTEMVESSDEESVRKDGNVDVGNVRTMSQQTRAAVHLTFSEVMNTVQHVAFGFQEKLDKLSEQTTLDEASLNFGVKIDGEGNVYIGKVGVGTNFNVSLKWKVQKPIS
ncbi:MAG: hypothetical protein B6242_11395 [Anaerolineaceae bacterium 4572_78]|nr:MAG: hypothetical protein B6242_11395 [Anaerolineaceae bacterium 4572_78]